MILVLFFLTYQLSCGMRYLNLSVPMSLLVLKENPGSFSRASRANFAASPLVRPARQKTAMLRRL